MDFWGFQGFLKLKNLGLYKPIFQPWCMLTRCKNRVESNAAINWWHWCITGIPWRAPRREQRENNALEPSAVGKFYLQITSECLYNKKKSVCSCLVADSLAFSYVKRALGRSNGVSVNRCSQCPPESIYTVSGKKRGHSILSITLTNLDTVS